LQGNPGTGIATQEWASRRQKDGRQGRPTGRWTPKPEFMKLRLAEDERWPGGCRERPRCADDDGEALAGLRGLEMNGSEFERENIVTDALSASPASNPVEPAR
jgi:hypothetical protein